MQFQSLISTWLMQCCVVSGCCVIAESGVVEGSVGRVRFGVLLYYEEYLRILVAVT